MGYMGSTARDLATFLHGQLTTTQVEALPVRADEVAAMPVRPTGWDIPLESGAAGGWFVDDFAGHRTVSRAGSLGDYTAHLILVPGADGLGIAVQTNASAFVAAGHEGQYELSLGLLSTLLGDEPTPVAPDLVMSMLVPAVMWAPGLVILAAAGRHIIAVRHGPARPGDGRRTAWQALRQLVPGLVYLGLGAIALIALPSLFGVPLNSIRIFYPDVGWGLTAVGAVALLWGLARTALALRSIVSAG
jgi:hypothetical protein